METKHGMKWLEQENIYFLGTSKIGFEKISLVCSANNVFVLFLQCTDIDTPAAIVRAAWNIHRTSFVHGFLTVFDEKRQQLPLPGRKAHGKTIKKPR